MNSFSCTQVSESFQDLGFGTSLWPIHFAEVIERRPKIDFFEIIPENLMNSRIRSLSVLEKIADSYPIVIHGVSLSICGAEPLDVGYLSKLRALARNFKARWISDHLCWTGVDGLDTRSLLPIPLTEKTLGYVADRVRFTQDFLGCRLVLENPAAYVRLVESSMPEWEFIGRLAGLTDCKLLLDINNVHVSATNLAYNAKSYIDALPRASVVQFHLGGHQNLGSYLLDTHDRAVSSEVWELYAHACLQFGPVSTVLEWDVDIPSLATLEAQLDAARSLRNQTCANLPSSEQFPESRKSYGRSHRCSVNELVSTQSELLAKQRAMQKQIVEDTSALDEAATSEQDRSNQDTFGPAPPQAGLKVHARAYRLTQLSCLRGRYPMLSQALGPAFKRFARDYLLQGRCREANVPALVEGFRSYLLEVSTCTDAVMMGAADIATFELAANAVIEDIESERKPSSTRMEIMAISLDEFSDLRFILATKVQLIFTRNGHYMKYICEQAKVCLKWSGVPSKYMALYLKDMETNVLYLDREHFELLQGLVDGLSVRQSLEYCHDIDGTPCSAQLSNARERCCEWADAGILGHFSF